MTVLAYVIQFDAGRIWRGALCARCEFGATRRFPATSYELYCHARLFWEVAACAAVRARFLAPSSDRADAGTAQHDNLTTKHHNMEFAIIGAVILIGVIADELMKRLYYPGRAARALLAKQKRRDAGHHGAGELQHGIPADLGW